MEKSIIVLFLIVVYIYLIATKGASILGDMRRHGYPLKYVLDTTNLKTATP